METEKPLKSWIESKVGKDRVFLSTNCQIIKKGVGFVPKENKRSLVAGQLHLFD